MPRQPPPILTDSQQGASRPDGQVWLSASAGAGKTQVLAARVLRLLLHRAAPESILCLTFTKAGAAQMADRIHRTLGEWVTLTDNELSQELFALGEEHLGNSLDHARSLFATVLDARGGGLRIQTIHSFSQSLLAAFPTEAGLAVGFQPLDDRAQSKLAAETLADMVDEADREGRRGVLDRLRFASRELGEDRVRSMLMRCAAAPKAMEALGSGLEAVISRRLFDGVSDIDGWVLARCTDGTFDDRMLIELRDANAHWLTKAGSTAEAGKKSAATISAWLAASQQERSETLEKLRRAWRKADGEPFAQNPPIEGYEALANRADAWLIELIAAKKLATFARVAAAILSVGQEYARAYTAAKRSAGVVDFNDMIAATQRLLDPKANPGISQWVRFKLDQSIDHVLVDEAQDTNAAQWDIVKALADEFYATQGESGSLPRTIFAVGDYKQAIFGFQGTDPGEMERAADYFAEKVSPTGQSFDRRSLSQSYRSSPPILAVVDAVIAEVGPDTMGLPEFPEPHQSAPSVGTAGTVTLLPPQRSGEALEPSEDDEEGEAEENWFSEAEIAWADALAQKVKGWTEGPNRLRLENARRDAEPGDVMILLRSRKDLARLIVSRLYDRGVPVAGIDRLRLNAPIAVQDLLAAMRFALQPSDDLALACLLVSPLIGWSQESLRDAAIGRRATLWRAVRDQFPREEISTLYDILAMADQRTPFEFLEAILSGKIGGRAKMIARLGDEVRDPIEELLNAALQFEANDTASLQGFLDWFSRGDVDVKRDAAKPENAVRVLTVHGAKGLESPIVVLADATADPDRGRKSDFMLPIEGIGDVPLFRPSSEKRAGIVEQLAEKQDRRDREEHWRLLYVALTRAEEHLFIGGALSKAQMGDKGMGEECWHVRVDAAMRSLGATVDANGGLTISSKASKAGRQRHQEVQQRWEGAVPGWARQPPGAEAIPVRPLTPSRLGVTDAAASPPPSAAQREAAARGVLLHGLFERLPQVDPSRRRGVAGQWLKGRGVADPVELIDAACAVIDNPDFAAVFAPDALAEAPLAGVVEGQVVAGTVDRLLVTDHEVLVVDFKTGRHVPASADTVPDYYKAQMGAYAAVLKGIFPDRKVGAALLYTHGAALIQLPPSMLDEWIPGRSH